MPMETLAPSLLGFLTPLGSVEVLHPAPVLEGNPSGIPVRLTGANASCKMSRRSEVGCAGG